MRRQDELLLLSHLRSNAREPLTSISKKTNIPVSTLFDKLKLYQKNIIAKHTALLDFRKLGFDLKAHMLFQIEKEKRKTFEDFLLTHGRVNSVFRINNGYDYFVEGVFMSLGDMNDFFEQSNLYGVIERKEYFVLKDIMQEGFLSYKPGFETLVMPEIMDN